LTPASPARFPCRRAHRRRWACDRRLAARHRRGGAARGSPWNDDAVAAGEVNAWILIEPDDSVTIRVAKSEMGEGVLTSMPMIVAEELACDWTKVKSEYASANRDLRDTRL